MNRLFSFFVLLLVAGSIGTLQAQDRIYLTDGSMIEAKVLTVSKYDIRYVDYDNQQGPEYFISHKDALMVVYENGTHEILTIRTDFAAGQNFRRNVFTFHLFDLVYNNFTLSYERINKDGTLGWLIPVSIGYGDVEVRDYENVVSSGLTLNFYPTGQGVWKYFMGPALELGVARDAYYYYYDDGYNHYEGRNEDEYFYGRLIVNNGVMFMPINNFHVAASAGLGVRYLSETYYEDDRVRTTFQFNMNLGYRF